MSIPDLIAWLAADHPASVLLASAPTEELPARIVYANAAFESMSGYPMREVVGRSPRMMQGARTDARAARLLSAAARAGRAARTVLVNYRRDGSDFLCEVALQPVRDAAGEVSHILALTREVRRRRGRPAGENARFLPLPATLGLAAFLWPQSGSAQRGGSGGQGTPRGSTTSPVASPRTTA